MARRVWNRVLWWLEGLAALQVVLYFYLSCIPTAVLVVAAGNSLVFFAPAIVAYGFYTLHCTRRTRGGGEVWTCTAGPGALGGIVRLVFAPGAVADAILSVALLMLSVLLAWAYDRSHADSYEPE